MSGVTYTIVAPTDASIPPPPGVIPDFQDPFSLRPYLNETASLALVMTGFFIILRIYTKARIVREFRWEDCKRVAASHQGGDGKADLLQIPASSPS